MNTQIAIKQLKLLEKYGSSMRLAAEGWSEEWQTLIATLLSARTRDEVTIVVCKKLFATYSLQQLATASLADIQKIIKPVNFFRNKSKSVSGCAKKLISDFKGKVPHDLDLLITIPGVGRKTANVFLSEYGTDAIGVDTHVSHISQKLGWTKHSNAHKIELDLKKLFPRKYWSKVNVVCVHFGKTYISTKKEDALLAEIAQKTKSKQ